MGLDPQVMGVEARLYKLTMYDAGGFFRTHKDTEKEKGMFGTLVIGLPVEGGYTGGKLEVRHDGTQKDFDWSTTSNRNYTAAAFFADCDHEILPVLSGRRLCLLYNLVRTTPGIAPVSVESAVSVALSDAVRMWEQEEVCSYDKLAIPLEHQYTEANLSFGSLKGNDRVIADCLRSCPALDVYLALTTKTERGTAEYDEYEDRYDRRNKHYWDDGESEKESESESEQEPEKHSMMEVCDTDYNTDKWVGVDGASLNIGAKISVGQEDLIDSDTELYNEEPDDEEYEGYMGNYGPELTYFYRKALLVIWPSSKTLSLVCEADINRAITIVQQRIKNAKNTGTGLDKCISDVEQVAACYIKNKYQHTNTHIAGGWRFPNSSNVSRASEGSHPLFDLCRQIGPQSSELVKKILSMMSTEGITSPAIAQSVHDIAIEIGWEVVGESVLELLKKSPLTQLSNMCKLATSLHVEAKKHVREEPTINIGTDTAGASMDIVSSTASITSNTLQEDKQNEAGGSGLVIETTAHVEPDIRIEGTLEAGAPSSSVIVINTFDSAISFTSNLQADKHSEAGASGVVIESIAHKEPDAHGSVVPETAAPSSSVSTTDTLISTPAISSNLREEKQNEAGGSGIEKESTAHKAPEVHDEVVSQTAPPPSSVSATNVVGSTPAASVVIENIVQEEPDEPSKVGSGTTAPSFSVSTNNAVNVENAEGEKASSDMDVVEKPDDILAVEQSVATNIATEEMSVEEPSTEVIVRQDSKVAVEHSVSISTPDNLETDKMSSEDRSNVVGEVVAQHDSTLAIEHSVSVTGDNSAAEVIAKQDSTLAVKQSVSTTTHDPLVAEQGLNTTSNTVASIGKPIETPSVSDDVDCPSNMEVVASHEDSSTEQQSVVTALAIGADTSMPVETPTTTENVDGASNMEVVASQKDSSVAEQVLYTTADIIALHDKPTGASADLAIGKEDAIVMETGSNAAHSVRTLASTSAVPGAGAPSTQKAGCMLLGPIRIVASRGISSFKTLTNESATALLLWILDLGDNVCHTHRLAMLSKVKELQMGVLLYMMNALEKDRTFVARAMKAEPPGPTYRTSYACIANALLQPQIIHKLTAQNIQTAFLNLNTIARCELKSQASLHTDSGELCTLETKFANIILGLSDNIKQPVLCNLLKTAALNEQKATDFVQQFLHARCNYLRRLPTARVLPSNGFPQANIPAHPTVTAFLRGEEASFTYQTGSGIVRARKIASEIQRAGRDNRWVATPGGKGQGAYVSIKKVNATTSAQRQAHASTINELKAVMRMIVNQNGNNVHGNMNTNMHTGAVNTAVIHQNGNNSHANIHMSTGGGSVTNPYSAYPRANTAYTSVRDQNGSTLHANTSVRDQNGSTSHGNISRNTYTSTYPLASSSNSVIDLVGSSSTSKSVSKRPAVQMSDGPYDDVEVVAPPPKKPVPVIDISDSP